MSHSVILLLGSNVSDREERLRMAVDELAGIVTVNARSEFYVSPDRSGLGAPYANIAVKCSVDMSVVQLSEHLAFIESRLGRTPQSKSMGIMPLDIDLVVWDEEIVSRSDYDTEQYARCVETLAHTDGFLNKN